jgi:hypothetical protein
VREDQPRAHSESSSVPSDKYTPSLEDNYRKHKRELSEGSSVLGKLPITPSTTASNSPSNFSKAHFLDSQDRGLDSIMELGSQGSNDSGTESERDRVRNQQQLQQQKVNKQKLMMASPCSRNNIINYQFVHTDDTHCLRGPADGCLCASSYQSLVGSGSHHSLSCSSMQCPEAPKHIRHYHHPHQVPRKRGTEVCVWYHWRGFMQHLIITLTSM